MSNKEYKINYLPIAKKDLNEIIEYIQADDPNTALELLNKIDESISQLSTFPYRGTTPDDENLQSKNYRMLVVKAYLVFYIVNEDEKEVEIRRIIHGKRKYDFLL